VASQVQIGSFQLPGYREAAVEPEAVPRKTTRKKNAGSGTRQLHAEGIEFVARPGQAEKLRKAIGLTQRNAQDSCDGLVGRLVFVSAEEERLVTVVTLWDGTEDGATKAPSRRGNRLGPTSVGGCATGGLWRSFRCRSPLPESSREGKLRFQTAWPVTERNSVRSKRRGVQRIALFRNHSSR